MFLFTLLELKHWCDTNLVLKRFILKSDSVNYTNLSVSWQEKKFFYMALSCSDCKKSLMNLTCGLPLSRPLTDNSHSALLKCSSTVSQQQMVLLRLSYLTLWPPIAWFSTANEETASRFRQVRKHCKLKPDMHRKSYWLVFYASSETVIMFWKLTFAWNHGWQGDFGAFTISSDKNILRSVWSCGLIEVIKAVNQNQPHGADWLLKITGGERGYKGEAVIWMRMKRVCSIQNSQISCWSTDQNMFLASVLSLNRFSDFP